MDTPKENKGLLSRCFRSQHLEREASWSGCGNHVSVSPSPGSLWLSGRSARLLFAEALEMQAECKASHPLPPHSIPHLPTQSLTSKGFWKEFDLGPVRFSQGLGLHTHGPTASSRAARHPRFSPAWVGWGVLSQGAGPRPEGWGRGEREPMKAAPFPAVSALLEG